MLTETVDLNTPMKKFLRNKIKSIINSLKPGKNHGYDEIAATFLRNDSLSSHIYITQFFDYISFHRNGKSLRLKWFLNLADDVKFYRPISLLPITFKVMELLFL